MSTSLAFGQIKERAAIHGDIMAYYRRKTTSRYTPRKRYSPKRRTASTRRRTSRSSTQTVRLVIDTASTAAPLNPKTGQVAPSTRRTFRG